MVLELPGQLPFCGPLFSGLVFKVLFDAFLGAGSNQDVLSSVGERDIHTGDYGEIFLIDAAGVSKTEFDLKLD